MLNKRFSKSYYSFLAFNEKEEDVSPFFNSMKEPIRETIDLYKGKDKIKFRLVITSEFLTPLPLIE